MTEYYEEINLAVKANIEVGIEIKKVNDILRDDRINDDVKIEKLIEFSKSISNFIGPIINDIEISEKELDKEIEIHKEFANNLKKIQDPLCNELIDKENELIDIMANEKKWLEKTRLFFINFLDSISYSGRVFSERKLILQYEINIAKEELIKKGIIKEI